MKTPSLRPLLLPLLAAFPAAWAAPAPLDFNRDVRPILSDKCFNCHGPDSKNQKSSFRLDTEEHAHADLGGYRGILPGHPEKSAVHERIHNTDPDEIMPPPELGRTLSPKEIETLDRWIREGAAYDKHWAFKLPVKAPTPALPGDAAKRVRNPIDAFVGERLREEGLAFAPDADAETLLRRAWLSLTGLQPSPEAVRAFRADTRPDAYERAVDGLLASGDHAERQALLWLDAARYADTDGFQNDNERSNWPWRDWVIQAFQENLPFDRFTLEQLAGDMLPNATTAQKLATAFNRNHRQNAEGGALAAEFLVENIIDRVETTSTVWLGLTMGCARCHNHKYDPLSQKEFFQLYAYFNNIGEAGTGEGRNANPILTTASPLQQVPPELSTRLDMARTHLKEAEKASGKNLADWAARAAAAPVAKDEWSPVEVVSAKVDKKGELTREEDGSHRLTGANPSNPTYTMVIKPGPGRVTALRLDALPHESFAKPRQLARSVNGNFVLSTVSATVLQPGGKGAALPFREARATFEQDGFPVRNLIDDRPDTGWAIYGKDPKPEPVSALFVLEQPREFKDGETLEVELAHLSSYADHNVGRFRLLATTAETPAFTPGTGLPVEVAAALKIPADKRSAKQKNLLADHHRSIDPLVLKARRDLEEAEKELKKSGLTEVPVMVMREREGAPAPAYLLNRGQYDDPDKSAALPRAVPAALFNGKPADMPADRLGLARWLVSRENPLTARVVVNRVWQQHFGIGLVKTSEDFGSQGEVPSHPELLDWLAVTFMDAGWDLRALHRAVVTSTTFRQSSRVTPALHARDPENRLLARGPRFRVDGFMVRDLALHASGLLAPKVGGPPVKPYQPNGLWAAVSAAPGAQYGTSKGPDLYRKSIYTYWKRAVNPPVPTIFDASGRETCNVKARRTNTPLQALALMNDVTYLEAARALAQRILLPGGQADGARLEALYLAATGLRPSSPSLRVLGENLTHFRAHFAGRAGEAVALLSHGEAKRDESLPVAEHAAWTAVAHLVLNLDRTITLE